jgi:hypothetical protein
VTKTRVSYYQVTNKLLIRYQAAVQLLEEKSKAERLLARTLSPLFCDSRRFPVLCRLEFSSREWENEEEFSAECNVTKKNMAQGKEMRAM